MSDIIVRVGPHGSPKWRRTFSPKWSIGDSTFDEKSLEFDLAEGDRVIIDVPLHGMSVVISTEGVLLKSLTLADKHSSQTVSGNVESNPAHHPLLSA